jgi:NAD+ synthase (glutamine-hydrolysing)
VPPHPSASTLRVAAAQIPNVVGDLEGNARRIGDAMAWAEDQLADVVVFPELALTGYPLADLSAREDFVDRAGEVLADLARRAGRTAAVVSTVSRVPPRRSWDTRERSVAIGAAVLCDGEVRGVYHKVLLPNYEIFDEARNFAHGDRPGLVWRIGDAIAGIAICEDLWSGDGPPERQSAGGARILLVPNASPFHREKPTGRLELAAQVARRNGTPVVYVNCVGGQDELVFDGGSLVVDADGELLHRAPQFAADRFVLDVPLGRGRPVHEPACTVHTRPARERDPLPRPEPVAPPSDDEQVWDALVLGTRDFVRRNGGTTVALGLSGGIDAAVTAAVAADALGPEQVLGLAMPGPDTAPEELEDARELAELLGIRFAAVPLRRPTAILADELAGVLEGDLDDRASGALEARMRAAIIWAACDQLHALPLATGNKSELSIGSATLHGDMAGAFAPLKDCRKTLLHRLARLRNARGPAIPERILDRTPDELPTDSDGSGPAYADVDAIVERYVEQGRTVEELVAAGFDESVVRGVLQLVDDAELERRQMPPGVRITARAFGQDLRMPITHAWRPFEAEQAEIAVDVPTLVNVS